MNSPKQLKSEISLLRDKLHAFILEDLYREQEARMAEVYRREKAEQDSPLRQGSWYRTDNGAAYEENGSVGTDPRGVQATL